MWYNHWEEISRDLRRKWFKKFEVHNTQGKLVLKIPFEIRIPSNKPQAFGYEFKQSINRAMVTIQRYSRVVFVPRRTETCYLIITSNEGCYYNGFDECFPEISIGEGCEGYRTVLHELLHALGFQHEQQRPDRENYVKLHLDNIREGRSIEAQFLEIDPSKYRWHDFEFDYRSNMMYDSHAFSKYGLPTITKRNGDLIPVNDDLSPLDIQKLNVI